MDLKKEIKKIIIFFFFHILLNFFSKMRDDDEIASCDAGPEVQPGQIKDSAVMCYLSVTTHQNFFPLMAD